MKFISFFTVIRVVLASSVFQADPSISLASTLSLSLQFIYPIFRVGF